MASWITYIYGAIVAMGGIMGYATAKSVPSLIAGVVSGIILLTCGWAMGQGRNWAVPVAAVVMLMLMVFFGKNYMDGQKVRNLALAIFSLLAAVGVLVASRK